MDIVSLFTIALVVLVELGVLVYLYRNYITTWNANKWELKARETGFLTELLEPVIMEVSEMVSTIVLEEINQRYLSATGVMQRVSKSGETSPELYGVKVADELLRSLNIKNPNALMVVKLAKELGGLVSDNQTQAEPTTLPSGKDLVAKMMTG